MFAFTPVNRDYYFSLYFFRRRASIEPPRNASPGDFKNLFHDPEINFTLSFHFSFFTRKIGLQKMFATFSCLVSFFFFFSTKRTRNGAAKQPLCSELLTDMMCVGKWKIFTYFLVCANPARNLFRTARERERRENGLEKLPAGKKLCRKLRHREN